jgi:hypothetical protein
VSKAVSIRVVCLFVVYPVSSLDFYISIIKLAVAVLQNHGYEPLSRSLFQAQHKQSVPYPLCQIKERRIISGRPFDDNRQA